MTPEQILCLIAGLILFVVLMLDHRRATRFDRQFKEWEKRFRESNKESK